MLDMKFVRENPELVRENIKKKFQDAKLPLVDEVLELDEKKRAAMVRDVLTRITDAAVYIPVSYSRTRAVYSNRIKDVSFAVTQYEIPFEKMSFTEAGK